MTTQRQFFLNLASNILNFAFSLLAGIWLTPYLIRHLGVGAYGLIPLTTAVMSFLSLFTVALNSSVGRFMTIALDRNDEREANQIFNTSFWSIAGILLLLLAPSAWMAFHADSLFLVPKGAERDAAWLFMAMIGVFCLTTMNSAFSMASFCTNRFDLQNAVNILYTLARVVLIVLFFNVCVPRVWHVGLATLAATALSMAGAVLIWKNLTPMLQICPSWFSLDSLRKMTGMGGWILVNQLGSILFLSIDLVVVNKFLGSEASGRYGAVMTWSTLLRSLAGVIAGVFTPTIIILHSRADIPGMVRYSRQAVKLLGLAMAIPIGLICGLSTPLLRLWLGEEYVRLAPLMSLMTCHLCINLAVLPLFSIQVATGRVRAPGIVTAVMGFLNLGLAIILAGPAGWGVYGVAAAGAVALTAKNLIFTPWYGARIAGVHGLAFYGELLPVATLTLCLIVASSCVASILPLSSWHSLVGAGTLLSGIAGTFAFYFVLNRSERTQLVSLFAAYTSRSTARA